MALSLGGVRGAGAAIPPAEGGTPPSFVVIQTDDQTIDSLYETFRAFPGAAETRAMPSTLDLIGKRGLTFNRYYVPYPLCCPSRVSLLTGRYAHNHGVKGNVQPNGGFTGFSFRGAMTAQPRHLAATAGYRTIHVGKFLNGYGDAPVRQRPHRGAGLERLALDPRRPTPHHYYYGYSLNDNGQIAGPFGDPGNWETREYGVRDDYGCPFAPTNGLPCYYLTDGLTNLATAEMLATPAEQPFYLQLDYTAPHGDFRKPAGPEPAPRHYDWFRGARLPHEPHRRVRRGNRHR